MSDFPSSSSSHAPPLRVAIIGAGPAGLTLAVALARRASSSSSSTSSSPALLVTVFERCEDHRSAATYNPDRSYTIDITGHGSKAIHYIDATERFDASLIPFRGIRVPSLWMEEKCPQPGWTGSRGDICRALLQELLDVQVKTMSPSVTLSFGTDAVVLSAAEGVVELRASSTAAAASAVPPRREAFDLIVGCDGAGSAVRRVLQAQEPGFAVSSSELSNHSTMLALDLARSGSKPHLDPTWLYVLSPPSVMMVAGAICGPEGKDDPMWFCQVGRAGKHSFASPEEARQLLVRACPAIESLASPAAISAFSKREALPTGRAKTCSALHGGRVALLGDAGAAFPPVGQGVNAAMEAATVFDQCLGNQLEKRQSMTSTTTAGNSELVEAALKDYTATWMPEAMAARTIAGALDLDQSFFVVAKQWVYNHFGVSALTNAKDARLSYSQALDKERRADRAFLALLAAAGFAGAAVAALRRRSR